jgi:hypothetical protein
MRRELEQLRRADGLIDGGAGRNRQLEQIAALLDGAAFEATSMPRRTCCRSSSAPSPAD